MLRAVLDDRLLTLPNIITLSRLLILPFWIPLVASEDHPAWAAVILAVMGATDFVDGQVARRTGQVSELGKILDPAADRVVLVAAVLTIVLTTDAVPWWISVPVLVREPIMFLAVLVLGLMGARRIDVSFVGKAGTFALMCSFPWLLYGTSSQPAADFVQFAGYVAGAIGVVLSWYAAFLYVPEARRALREAREERAGAPDSTP
jgi:cardiolipin synthase (CMP-forming)